MPQPVAYSHAEVILAGQKLETAAGGVTQAALHAQLGGRGLPSTPWKIWEEYVALRGPWTPPAPSAAPIDLALSPKAAAELADLFRRLHAYGELTRGEAEELHTLRSAQAIRANDDLLAQNAAFGRELEALSAELAALRGELADARAFAPRLGVTLPVRGLASAWPPAPA